MSSATAWEPNRARLTRVGAALRDAPFRERPCRRGRGQPVLGVVRRRPPPGSRGSRTGPWSAGRRRRRRTARGRAARGCRTSSPPRAARRRLARRRRARAPVAGRPGTARWPGGWNRRSRRCPRMRAPRSAGTRTRPHDQPGPTSHDRRLGVRHRDAERERRGSEDGDREQRRDDHAAPTRDRRPVRRPRRGSPPSRRRSVPRNTTGRSAAAAISAMEPPIASHDPGADRRLVRPRATARPGRWRGATAPMIAAASATRTVRRIGRIDSGPVLGAAVPGRRIRPIRRGVDERPDPVHAGPAPGAIEIVVRRPHRQREHRDHEPQDEQRRQARARAVDARRAVEG